MGLGVVVLAVLALLSAGLGALAVGRARWARYIAGLRAGLRAGSTGRAGEDEALGELPTPVQRYLQAVIEPGTRRVVATELTQSGTFDMGTDAPRWVPFTAEHSVATDRPGFVWDARVRMGPGVTAFVQDSYVQGKGALVARALGLVTVVDIADTPDLAVGELMRYLAEAAWYPTALLPGGGVRWTAIDDTRARASLTDGETTVELVFEFDEQGLIQTVSADARPRDVAGRSVPTPWTGRFWDYAWRNGMRVPLAGEVAWVLPEGRKPYWRGRIESITHDFTD